MLTHPFGAGAGNEAAPGYPEAVRGATLFRSPTPTDLGVGLAALRSSCLQGAAPVLKYRAVVKTVNE